VPVMYLTTRGSAHIAAIASKSFTRCWRKRKRGVSIVVIYRTFFLTEATHLKIRNHCSHTIVVPIFAQGSEPHRRIVSSRHFTLSHITLKCGYLEPGDWGRRVRLKGIRSSGMLGPLSILCERMTRPETSSTRSSVYRRPYPAAGLPTNDCETVVVTEPVSAAISTIKFR
jgi:hypothetical protein